MKRLSLLVLIALIAAACTKIDYVGKEYPETFHVDIYFSLDDIERDYEVMGHMTATGDDFISAEKMQEDMLKKAREKGSDGLVILGLEHYSTGAGETTYSETKTLEEDKETTTASSKTTVEEKKEIKGTLIKYK